MSIHSEWINSLKTFNPSLKLPPPSLEELSIEYLEIKPNDLMIGKLPFQRKFTNPTGHFQGGFLSAAMDEVFGPLAYISTKKPCHSLSLNLTFIRPFKESDEFCLIEAKILSITQSFIFMKGEIKTQEGKLIACAETHMKKAEQ